MMSARHGIVIGLAAALAAACQGQAEPRAPAPPPPASAPTADGHCEHGLPRELCTRCDPALAAVFQSKGDWCAEHGFPESFCPICHPGAAVPGVDRDPAGAATAAATPDEVGTIEGRVVRFRSPEIERTAGIETIPARSASASAFIACTARIAFDADRLADVRAIVPGIVRAVRVELGSAVEPGTPLFELESTRVGEVQGSLQTARERLRTARANLARQRSLLANDLSSALDVELAERELASAQADVRTAEATLRMAGAERSAPSGRYVISAPIAGTVVRRPAVVGMLATEDVSLATLADTTVMWALADVPEADAARVAIGQDVVVTVDGEHDDAALAGEITWIAAEVDPRTRTVTARAELANRDGRLRANQFARARIRVGAPQTAVMVPRAALQRVGERDVVFVRARAGIYAPRVVVVRGGEDGDLVQVEGRVAAGDAVVTTGAVLLRTEVIPNSIGAGCCEVDAPGRER